MKQLIASILVIATLSTLELKTTPFVRTARVFLGAELKKRILEIDIGDDVPKSFRGGPADLWGDIWDDDPINKEKENAAAIVDKLAVIGSFRNARQLSDANHSMLFASKAATKSIAKARGNGNEMGCKNPDDGTFMDCTIQHGAEYFQYLAYYLKKCCGYYAFGSTFESLKMSSISVGIDKALIEIIAGFATGGQAAGIAKMFEVLKNKANEGGLKLWDEKTTESRFSNMGFGSWRNDGGDLGVLTFTGGASQMHYKSKQGTYFIFFHVGSSNAQASKSNIRQVLDQEIYDNVASYVTKTLGYRIKEDIMKIEI